MQANANGPSDAKLLSDLKKFAASAGLPFPGSEPPPASTAPEPPASAGAGVPPSAEPASPKTDPGSGNAAIDRCLAAHAEARRKKLAAGKSAFDAKSAGKEAYLRALPPLVGPQNVADFIACIMRGFIEEIILPFEINQYLYAAQVANCVKNPNLVSAPKRPQGRPRSAPKSVRKSSSAVNSSINTQS